MTQYTREFTSAMVKDVQFSWAHLGKPTSPFGTEIYDIRVEVPNKRAKELEAFGKVTEIKDKEGKLTGWSGVNIKKKAVKADGTPAAKVKVVDANKNAIDPDSVGNGSKGNVIVSQTPYQIKLPNGKVTKEGIQTILMAVQVTDLKVYENKSVIDMFDIEGDGSVDDAF